MIEAARRRYARPDPELLATIEAGFQQVRTPLEHLKTACLEIARRPGGVPALRRYYDQLWMQLFSHHRYETVVMTGRRAAQLRVARLAAAATQRYPDLHVAARIRPSVVGQVVDAAVARPLGKLGWKLSDPFWPRDAWIKQTFFAQVERGRRKLRDIHAAAPSKRATPTIDPRHRKFSYPIDASMSDLDLVERALDDIVVARGAYYAEVGVRDFSRILDQAAAVAAAQDMRVIELWCWLLSPEHDSADSSPDICDDLAVADVGFGPGIYSDDLLPDSHPNCWCSMEPVWSSPGAAEDPSYSPPAVPADYEDRVRSLMSAAQEH